MNYRDLPMNVRLERIGELLAKAVHLCVKQEKEKEVCNEEEARADNN